MKYKLIALDLDGTLLNDSKVISEFTKSILQKLEEKGVKVIIATGRSYSSLKPVIKELNLENPVICYNGAMIRDGKTDEITYHSQLPVNVARDVIKLSRRDNISLVGYKDGDFCYEKVTPQVISYSGLTGLGGVLVDFDTLDDLLFTKCILIDDHSILLESQKELMAKHREASNIAFSKVTYLEFMDISASKGKALHSVATQYGIKPDEIIAFGDGQNDLEMLEYAGKGIIMKNGFEILKDKFENSEYTNDQDGVAKYMERLLNE